jgi:hypothetical protein
VSRDGHVIVGSAWGEQRFLDTRLDLGDHYQGLYDAGAIAGREARMDEP